MNVLKKIYRRFSKKHYSKKTNQNSVTHNTEFCTGSEVKSSDSSVNQAESIEYGLTSQNSDEKDRLQEQIKGDNGSDDWDVWRDGSEEDKWVYINKGY